MEKKPRKTAKQSRKKKIASVGRPTNYTPKQVESAREAREWWLKELHMHLFDIFNVLIEKAKDGDMHAIRELLDRGWGKAPVAVEHTGKDGDPIIFLPLELMNKHAIKESTPPFDVKEIAVSNNGLTKP